MYFQLHDQFTGLVAFNTVAIASAAGANVKQ